LWKSKRLAAAHCAKDATLLAVHGGVWIEYENKWNGNRSGLFRSIRGRYFEQMERYAGSAQPTNPWIRLLTQDEALKAYQEFYAQGGVLLLAQEEAFPGT
jgi:hypothetical protein